MEKAVSGEFISIVFRGGFHYDMVEMLFHRLFHLAKNTFLEEKLAESFAWFTYLPIGKEEVISLLHGTFKGKNTTTDVSLIKTSHDSVFIDFVLPDYFFMIT